MPTAWPPASAPAWPPIEAWRLEDLIKHLKIGGWTDAAPTNAEQTAYFNATRCDLDHPVVGWMIVSPEGVRFPFAVCNTQHGPGLDSRAFFFLWPPYYSNDWSDE